MNVRCGVDIVDISRFVKIVEENNQAFINKCFTENEIEYCNSAKALNGKAERFAARFAAKEAFGKALGSGVMSEGVSMRDIEVIKDGRGAPGYLLTGNAAAHASEAGMNSVSLSLSHDGGMAVAYCVMLAEK